MKKVKKWVLFQNRIKRILEEIAEVSKKEEKKTYLVGGPVRDLLLKKRNIDIDIAVEGDIKQVGESLAKKYGGEFKFFPRFYTGKVLAPSINLDIAQTRKEVYSVPGRLPEVKPVADIKKDLERRDFSINAMAIPLSKPMKLEVIDPFGGKADLKKGVIKVLHPKSFTEDPTRILRAVRFKVRFGFKYSRETLKLLKDAVRRKKLTTVSMDRILSEFKLISEEEKRIKIVKELSRQGVLSIFKRKKRLKWKALEKFSKGQAQEFFMFFLSHFEIEDNLTREEKETIKGINTYFEKRARLKKAKKKSNIYWTLKKMPIKSLKIVSIIETGEPKDKLQLFFKKLRHIKPSINGNDLKRLGIKEGAIYGKIFENIIKMKLDGKLKSKEDEIWYVKNFLKK